jgi:hypothetical protein
MKLKKWALSAEIASGFAVVITLIFLIIEVRENTEVARADACSELMRDLNNLAIAITQDDRMNRIWQQYHSGEAAALSDEETARLGVLLRNTFRTYETAYYRKQYGTLGESEWARFEEMSCYHRERQTEQLWEQSVGPLTSEFGSYVTDLCPHGL